ncbi:fungal-specific transcription factor domain-containing protein [Stachybotrys elegans]|uniref:Fungal-specific transcription factor domain-containing protein n=1 Tax=Stachybotrys elegans TaxID=80388 RepID=A0A8K0T433_9HYPO|nr:fungal-specific transcription factor domain-containing protein [Stachybotrys elegans]
MTDENEHGADEHAVVDDLTPEEASRIIHSHRKVRYGTACWPCRQRKVKCDNKQPCENCVKREHPQLCSYKPNRTTMSKATSSSEATVGRKRARSMSEAHPRSSLERQDSWPRTLGSLDDSDSAADRYLGQNSIPALLREQSSSNNRTGNVDIRQDVRSILGLDTSAPFPLMSSHHLQRLTQDISTELPSDREVMKLFRTYKEIPQPFWGFVMDIDELESNLMVYLEDRSRNAKSTVKSSRTVTASWLAILFAVLAVGSQYHESPYHTRTKDAQKYMQISFHFLRLGNFLLRPSFDSMQAMLLISFVLVNDMKAEASWALLGLTCRLAQSLGLHRPSVEDREGTRASPKSKEMTRRKLWWTCIWHDTLTSLSFDRAPVTNFPSCSIPIATESSSSGYTYLETMYHLIEIISRRLNPDMASAASYAQIIENCEAVEALRGQTRGYMREKDSCKSALHRLQYYAVRLHTSFVISVACRPALKRDCPFDPHQKKALADKCKENLTETVRMFLAMHQLSVIPTRSWAFTYHGLSSALLLGIMCETQADPEVRQLQGDLIQALSATAAKDVSSPEPHVVQTDKDIELSGPLYRALTALKNIYAHGSIVGTALKKEGDSSTAGSGNRTPLLLQSSQQPSAANQQYRALHGTDPREDAAMAMAEMQNGASLQDFSGSEFTSAYTPSVLTNDPRIPFPQQLQPGVPLDNGAGLVDPSQYMAPMDLFHSIWVESPDSWNSSMDAMNFDFLAQPPPGQPHQQFYF